MHQPTIDLRTCEMRSCLLVPRLTLSSALRSLLLSPPLTHSLRHFLVAIACLLPSSTFFTPWALVGHPLSSVTSSDLLVLTDDLAAPS